MYTTDARLLPPNGEMVEGRDNIQNFWQGAISAGLNGELGGVTNTDKGKYVVQWKREGRNWKLAVDIFNSNMPLPTATP